MTRDRMHALVNTWSHAVATNDALGLEAIVAPALRDGVFARTRAFQRVREGVVVEHWTTVSFAPLTA